MYNLLEVNHKFPNNIFTRQRQPHLHTRSKIVFYIIFKYFDNIKIFVNIIIYFILNLKIIYVMKYVYGL